MDYVKLGQSDLTVSKICLGTMTFGEQNTESEAHEQMDYALGHGVNFFDTAELYAVPSNEQNNGLTEKYIGTWFSKSGNRDKVILATKITGPSPNLAHIRPNLGFDRRQIMETVEKNLQRLQTDYIDIYQLHWPERAANFFGKLDYVHDTAWEDNFTDIIKTMNDLIQAGKIRYWGISNETAWGAMHYLRESERSRLQKCLTIQNPYNLLNRSFEVGLAEVSIREHMPLLAYSPLAFGLLTGKYHHKKDRVNARLNQFKQLSRYSSELCWQAAGIYINIAQEAGMSPTQLSLAFVNTRPFVASNIIGATSIPQLKENIETWNIKLDEDIVKAINEVHKRFSNPAP